MFTICLKSGAAPGMIKTFRTYPPRNICIFAAGLLYYISHVTRDACAIVAQLDRAFGSDNCDRVGFAPTFLRYSAVYACKNAVVNGSQTTN